jgi:hypothetical protein
LGNKNTPVSPADQGAAQPSQPARPVIDLTSGNVSTPPSPPPAQPNNAPARPIIDLN